jgi:hypothetical protein
LIAVALASGRIPPEARNDSDVHRTKAGFEFSDYRYGYGVFDPSLFQSNLKIMNGIQQKYGSDKDATAESTTFDRRNVTRSDGKYNEHTFQIKDNVTVEKLTLFAHMPLQTLPPGEFIVVSPSGREVHVPATVGPGIARLTTEAFLGENAKGDWKILTKVDPLLPNGNARIAFGPEARLLLHDEPAATLTIHGQEPGKDGQSNISRFLEAAPKPLAPAATVLDVNTVPPIPPNTGVKP